MSNVGSTPLVLNASPLLASATLCAPVDVDLPISSTSRSLGRAPPREARRRTLNRPSPWDGEGEVVFERTDLLRDGVRSFHAATMFRTDVSGDRGDVWGRRSDEAVGVAVVVKPVKVLLYVPDVEVPGPVYVLGPLRDRMNVSVLVGTKRESEDRVVPRAGGDINEDIVVTGSEADRDEPVLLFVGEEGREL